MASSYVRITGADKVGEYLRKVREGAETAGGETILVGSNLVYAFGAETGRHRGGSLARRSGGTSFLQGAYNAVKPDIPGALAAALPGGGPATLRAMIRLGSSVRREERALAPVLRGKLRRSIRMVIGGGQ